MKMFKINQMFLIALSLILILSSCSDNELTINPFDPNLDDYEDPETVIDSGPDGTYVVNSVTFTYSGNELVQEYSYRLESGGDVIIDWSDWSSGTSVQIDSLDEGSYTFLVKGRYSEGVEDATPASRTFAIDAVQSSSIRIFPQLINSSINEVFELDVYAEDISNVALIQFELEYDNQSLSIYGDIEKGALLTNFQGYDIFIDEESANTILISIGLGGGGSNELGLSGTGSLCRINFTAGENGSSSDLTITSSEFRDGSNNIINIVDVINGRVEIE